MKHLKCTTKCDTLNPIINRAFNSALTRIFRSANHNGDILIKISDMRLRFKLTDEQMDVLNSIERDIAHDRLFEDAGWYHL